MGTLTGIVERLARSAVANEGRHVDCLAPGDLGSRARVDSRDLVAREEDADDQMPRLALPPPTSSDGDARPRHVQALLVDHGRVVEPPALPGRDLARETHAAPLALQIGLDHVASLAEDAREEGLALRDQRRG